MLSDTLSATFAALADPTRRAILARLASGEVSVTELAQPASFAPPWPTTLPAAKKPSKNQFVVGTLLAAFFAGRNEA